MAASYWAGTGDGTTTDFPVPFAYLDALNVFAKVAGVTASFVWLTSTTIRITPAPASGARVFVFRQSPSTLLVDFTTEGLLTENDLDTAYRHSLYLAEEAVDTAQLAMTTDLSDGKFDAQSKAIKNVAAPVSANDAVRLVDLQAAQVVAGNVPTPVLADVGKFLKATAAGTYSFQQIQVADITGLASGATTTVGTAATKNTGTSGATVPLLNTLCTWSAGLVITGAGLVLGAPTGGDKGAGTLNATALYVNGALPPVTKEWVSTPQTITSGGFINMSHTLGVAPKIISLELVCQTSEGGYNAGATIQVPPGAMFDGSSVRGFQPNYDLTVINGRFGSATNAFVILNLVTGAAFNITNANWKMVVRAWA